MESKKQNCEPGLHLVATPIGAARDITLRALDVLETADIIAAEDTRTIRHLMSIYGIALNGRKLTSYHDRNGNEKRPAIMRNLADNKSVCLVSEAGTPLIADPGWKLVQEATKAEIPIHVVPGASSVVAALLISGMPTDKFMFVGFLPPRAKARSNALLSLINVQATLVFFESARRLPQTLATIRDIMGSSRPVAVCREITKKFEEVWRGNAADLATRSAHSPLKGEIVVLVDQTEPSKIPIKIIAVDLRQALSEMSMSDAVKVTAETHSLNRRDVYQLALSILREGHSPRE